MGKEYIPILVIILISVISGCLEEEEKKKADDFTLVDIDNNSFTLSNHFGKVIVINFMATWCPPCKEEMPDLIATNTKYGDKIVMISIDTNATKSDEDLKKFKQKYNASWIFALDNPDEDVMGKYRVFGIPIMFVIDIEGYISYMHFGLVKENELVKEIEKS